MTRRKMFDRRFILGVAGLTTGIMISGCNVNPKKVETQKMANIKPNYMELKAPDLPASKAFYSKAFGFEFTDYGPEYAAVEGGDVDIGLAAGSEPAAPLPTFESDDLEATYASVVEAGGKIVKEIFAFPGGRRFQFLDPAGNELAIYQPA